jgi:hypothetical protein
MSKLKSSDFEASEDEEDIVASGDFKGQQDSSRGCLNTA